VVCGVGHETDVTLADFAADLRAPTPTAAAEAVAPLRDELLAQLSGQTRRLLRACALRLNMTQQRLDRVAASLARPAERVGREQLRLALLARRSPQSVAAALGSRRELLRQTGVKLVHAGALARARLSHREQQYATRLGALDPMQVVARGYALVHTGGGELVVCAAQIANGDTLRLTLARDDASVQVSSVQHEIRTAG
jgi:exodeoxyribonuclease VII large subunit